MVSLKTRKYWGRGLINPQNSPLRILLDVEVAYAHNVTGTCMCLWCTAESVSSVLLSRSSARLGNWHVERVCNTDTSRCCNLELHLLLSVIPNLRK